MVFTAKFYIGYSDINKDYNLTNTSLLKLFENVASMHSHVAKDDINESEGRWFLTGYHVKITKRPQYGETVTIKTWSRDMKGVQASREFEVYNEKDELCLTGLSNWIRINAKTLRLERISPELYEAYGSEPERSNFNYSWIEKLKESEKNDYEKEFHIERNFIDANNHMNNVYYLDLATNILPEEVYQAGELNQFIIMYKSAIKYDETVNCSFAIEDDGYRITIKAQDKSDLKAVIKMIK
ncbi:MAG: thioesterase [Treponema sp.]|uniref:acyl-[acyl-carrier-protein] thioesterase n=1 Tax=Treponema sp. TaxID=166 RepID=UPI00298DC3EA|nr:acyl-ACP thioesterase domain-containing protein [Treponema sp.]MCQ2601072.1 thioesterase [Treponema sp.]